MLDGQEDVSVRVTLQRRSEERWDIWVTRTSTYLPTHANTDPENSARHVQGP